MPEFILTEEDEQKVAEGEAASLLLDSPAFILAIERVRKDCAEGILTSNPQASAAREQLYNLSRGLSAVTEELARMSSEAASIIENASLHQQDDEEVQADEPDHDVFY